MIYTFKENYQQSSTSKKIQYVITEKGCFDCISHHKEKFGYFSIIRNGKREKLHRYIYRMTKGEIPKDLVIRHKCDNPSCINPEHLELGTILDNVRDRVERNRTAKQKGTTNPMSRIDEETVIKILFDNNGTQYDIAERYGVSQIHVSQIKRGKRWRHLTEHFNCYLEEIHSKRSLSEDEICEIFLDKLTSTRNLALKYKISESAISNIRNGKKHIKITKNLP
jgi:hypothetical protein